MKNCITNDGLKVLIFSFLKGLNAFEFQISDQWKLIINAYIIVINLNFLFYF